MSLTATFSTSGAFLVSGDYTSEFHNGRRVKANCGVDGYKYGTVLSSSYSNPNTTVNLDGNNDPLTANLTEVWFGIVGIGSDQSLPDHEHIGNQGDGGSIAILNNLETIKNDSSEPTGFILNDTYLQNTHAFSFDNSNRTLTLTPSGADGFSYYINGTKYTKTSSESFQISAAEGLHFIYYNGENLEEFISTTSNDYYENVLDIYRNKCYVAVLYWDNDNSKQIYFGEEDHGSVMNWTEHLYHHLTIGPKLESGGLLTSIIADGNGDLDTHCQFGITQTIFWDEDIRHDLSLRNSTDIISIYYRSGLDVDNIWRINETSSFPVLVGGNGRAVYNQLTGGSWQLTELSSTNYVLAHVFTYNDEDRKFAVIMGQSEYSSIGQARDGALTEINDITTPIQEYRPLGTLIIQTANGYANTPKSRIRTTDAGDDYIDFRDLSFSGGNSLATLDHGALQGLSDDDHIQYVLADGTRNISVTPSGSFSIVDDDGDNIADFNSNGAVDLYNNNVKSLSTDLSDEVVPIPGVSVPISGAFYLGDANTDGTWRITRLGSDLVFQRRETGTYVTKNTISA